MRILVFEVLTATALTLGAIIALSNSVLASDVMVTQAFARASAVPTAKAGAVYMTLMNHGAGADRLLSITTDAADSAELHETKDVDGVVKMLPVEALEIPVNGAVQMKPGGLHIMLTGLNGPLKMGGTLKLQLTFERAGIVGVEARIGEVAAATHTHVEGLTGN